MNNPNEKNQNELPAEQSIDERKAKINRAIYVTAIILLISVALIAGIVSAANRAKKDPIETPPESTLETPKDSTPNQSTPDSTPESESKEPDNTDVSAGLPEFRLPVSGNLSTGHDPDVQVFSPTMKDYRVHLGVDINTAEGAPVYAAAEGVVKKVWEDQLMGWCVAVAHDGEAVSYYKNLSETLATGINEGASVTSGQLIGTVGDSAMIEVAQEPHLHFEMTVKGLQVDPSEYFSKDVWAELDGDNAFEG